MKNCWIVLVTPLLLISGRIAILRFSGKFQRSHDL
jgi:hypothetical protein